MNASDYGDSKVTFYIGQHEDQRSYHVTQEVLDLAQDHNYDMLTSPITNDVFHSRVLNVLSGHFRALEDHTSSSLSIKGLSDLPPAPLLTSLLSTETMLEPDDPVSQLILVASSWTDLTSPDPLIAEVSRQVLVLETAYAGFCGATNIIVHGPRRKDGHINSDGLAQYARAIQDALRSSSYINIQLMLFMSGESSGESVGDLGDLSAFARGNNNTSSDDEVTSEPFATWEEWDTVRSICKYNARLSVALNIPRHLPARALQDRWFAEPLRILLIPASSFHHNSHSETSLTAAQKDLVHRYMHLHTPPWILLSNIGAIPGLGHTLQDGDLKFTASNTDGDARSAGLDRSLSEADPTPAQAAKAPYPSTNGIVRKGVGSHLAYMRSLQRQQKSKDALEQFGAGYQDYLQNPLQPLTDNLESVTYEVFEKDPVKYDWYERAIERALRDWIKDKRAGSGPDGKIVVAVVGAGRGPLVTKALNASEQSGVEIDMWAVEKNPNAYVLLQGYALPGGKWHGRVRLCQSDMRSWKGPSRSETEESSADITTSQKLTYYPVDIMISELLGSFADNELSPECLDGVQHVLNPTNGISIPTSYSAWLTPIAAPKLHQNILARKAQGDEDAAEIPYVVMLHQINYLSTTTIVEPRSKGNPGSSRICPLVAPLWEFEHPAPPQYLRQSADGASAYENRHNERFAKIDYTCFDRGICNGLAGYFETVLYDPQDRVPTATTTARASSSSNVGTPKPGSIELSTNPATMDIKSKDMISWFPIYFPLKSPLYFPDDSRLSVSIWRRTDSRKVWYEWLVEVFLLLGEDKPIRIASSELHSSIKNACMM